MTSFPRKNGKPVLAATHELCEWAGVPIHELEEVAAKYRPTLERLGILDNLHPYQEVMLFIWLWKHDKEIEDAGRGVIRDLRVEWED